MLRMPPPMGMGPFLPEGRHSFPVFLQWIVNSPVIPNSTKFKSLTAYRELLCLKTVASRLYEPVMIIFFPFSLFRPLPQSWDFHPYNQLSKSTAGEPARVQRLQRKKKWKQKTVKMKWMSLFMRERWVVIYFAAFIDRKARIWLNINLEGGSWNSVQKMTEIVKDMILRTL